jgi:alanine-synthesizing transaminase
MATVKMEILQHHLICTGFNWPTPDHLRIVLLPEETVLGTAMERMGNFLASYRQ